MRKEGRSFTFCFFRVPRFSRYFNDRSGLTEKSELLLDIFFFTSRLPSGVTPRQKSNPREYSVIRRRFNFVDSFVARERTREGVETAIRSGKFISVRRFQQHEHFANCSNYSGILQKLCEAIVDVRAPFSLKIVARCDDRGNGVCTRKKFSRRNDGATG